MTDRKKTLLKEAYQLGYFIGFKGHSEWAGWVREKKEELYKKAEDLGIYEAVKEAYRKGKELGQRDRAEELQKGLVVKLEPEDLESKPEHAAPIESEEVEAEERTEIEHEYVEFLQTTKLTMPPELLDTLKHLEAPKMLRLGD
ncbi:hypothetical protein TEU_04485 [Thermococcus eurythermalis]|uniref:Uncharacterized protein n=1 Tax=Thermococcus eurythermalis TaxID=1505907 RepID=A0A097QT67_9EURY|nr:hypothetical protein [Thermococcus eurythermalis]AIU69653.1 hypothetical protein TEU_04485 [Thermococcus eurythermalis]